MRSLAIVFTWIVVFWAGLCWGGTIYIKPDGTGDVATIGDGMAAAGVGDTLLLGSGTFTGAGNHGLTVPNKSLTIVSETGNPDDCAVDCDGDLGFYFPDGAAVIKGITMTDAIWSALRVWTDAGSEVDLRVRGCIFSDCFGPGGGINLDCYGEVRITGCTFRSNLGGAVCVNASGYLDVLIDSCTFCGNTDYYGGAIRCTTMEVMATIANSVFYNNSATEAGGAIELGETNAYISGCTFFANSAPCGSAIDGGLYGPDVVRCILAYGAGGSALHGYDTWWDPWLSCTNIYGNEGGNWVGVIADDLGQNGNFSACPSFCSYEIEPYDLHLCSSSPCLPGNHPDGVNCGLIGALGQGCDCGPSRVEPITWGAIKAMYR
jgi:hypothetical protein